MPVHELREVERTVNLWVGYRDELIATAMTLSLVVVGSFVLTERFTQNQGSSPAPLATNQPQTLGAQDSAPIAVPPPTPAAPPPTPDLTQLTEVPYGQDGDYDYENYSISFRNPRITFDAKTNSKRKLWVNVWLKNKSLEDGLPTRLSASIIKDGTVIVSAAVLYVSESRLIKPGEEASFTASLSIIEGTDVREIKYKPGDGIVETSHFLYP